MASSLIADRTIGVGQYPGSGYIQRARNISGAAVAEGAVVVLSATGTNADILYSFTTTTTADDNAVMGVIVDGPVLDGAVGQVMLEGFADKVLVNGTTDIAAGDYLGTYTEAGIAAKSLVGTGIFAQALEAYSTDDSAGEIKAIILGPMAARVGSTSAGSATLLVAASDAPQAMKDRADYVCDGTADQTEIDTALNALPSTGGIVQLTPGNYSFTAAAGNPSLNMAGAGSGAVLRGAGISTVIKLADSQSSTYDDIIRITTGQRLEDFVLDGNKANQTDGNDWTNQRGIQTNNGSNHSDIVIRNVEVKNVVYVGIFMNRVSQLRIENVYAHTNGLNGIRVGGSSAGSDVTIDSCIANGNGGATDSTGGDEDGIVCDPVNQLAISNCITNDNTGDGIHIENCDDFSLMGHVAQNNTGNGIVTASGAEHGSVIGCVASDNGADGFQTGAGGTMARYVGCVANGNGAHGIHARCNIVSVYDSHIVLNDNHGIFCEGNSNGGFISGNYINANSQATTNTWDGIHIADRSGTNSSGIIITANRIIGADHRYGIRENDSSQTNTLVAGNRLTDATTALVSLQATSSRVALNTGYVSENSGTATINSGGTSVTVTHGLSETPAAANISIVATENPTNDPGNFWVDTITSTQFNINCRADPGASNLDFSWQAVIV